MFDDTDNPDRPDFRIARAQSQLRDLEALRALGMKLAHDKARQASRECEESPAPAESPTERDSSEAFNRVSRGVRVTIVLEARLGDYLAALLAGDPRAEFWPRRAPKAPSERDPESPEAPEPYHFGPREDLRGNVLELIQADCMDPDERDRIYAGLKEGFYESERYDEFLDLPIVEAMNAICKDLGVEPDWSRLNGRSWPPWRRNTVPPEPAPPPEAEDPEAEDPPGLTPPPSSSQLGLRVLTSQQGVCEDDEFSRHCNEDEALGFSGEDQAFGEGLELRVGSCCGEGCHEEGWAQSVSPMTCLASSADLAGVARVWGQSSQACDLSSVERAELGNEGQQGAGDNRTEADNGAKALFVGGELGGLLEQVGDSLVGLADLRVEEGDLLFEEARDDLMAWRAASVFRLGAVSHQILAMAHETGQSVAISVLGLPSDELRASFLAVAAEPAGVDAISLGASSQRGDVTFNPQGVGAVGRQAQPDGDFEQGALMSARHLADQEVIVGKALKGVDESFRRIGHAPGSARDIVEENDVRLGDIRAQHAVKTLDRALRGFHDVSPASDCLRAHVSGPSKSASRTMSAPSLDLDDDGREPHPGTVTAMEGGVPAGQPGPHPADIFSYHSTNRQSRPSAARAGTQADEPAPGEIPPRPPP